MFDLAIQIVNYKTKSYLLSLIDQIIGDLWGRRINYKIFILDNNSGDDLSDIEEKFHNRVEIFYSDKNIGFGAGNNLLAKKSDSKYILILNPDIEFIEKGTIQKLLERLEKNPSFKIIGPKLLLKNKTPQSWDHGEVNGFLAHISNKALISYWKNTNEPISAAWVSGAFFLIERSIFEKINGFDENIFLYGEEDDLCLRVRQENYKILYDPTVRAIHYGGVVASRKEHMPKSQEYLIKKHYKGRWKYIYAKIASKILEKVL